MKKPQSEIIIYQTQNKKSQVEVQLKGETLWLSLQQIADLFDRDKSVISRHLGKIFKEKELDRKTTVANYATVAEEGKRRAERDIEYFNLDAIISVGYRINSKQGTQFRQWSSSVLREHLTKGYTLSKQRFEKNAAELQAALELVSKAAKSSELTLDSGRGLVDVIARYTQTFLLLQRYDEGLLADTKGTKGGNLPTVKEARASLAKLKSDLISRKEATELFAKEREDGLASILGNLDQTVFGDPAYPNIEEKAAHLLYFVVKNHPFIEGNKLRHC